ncbi:Protein ltv1 [Dimargaris cristalligena]|uniref:Low temperature viability protein-domain-containing protein n=1 Tax=Dimargaris cristalligena TaxID=215637 RepID=A0A4P9ZV87_9FUNG|nr:Protein ltv1 [Dimargaris cristalligena]RKP36742.1 Low temperature viability protein-domain-containing protein [Dimargaris cristalligena]|eukprot:RKP36742.1 Low temperature viability protein-domain-containing protein [Dimargaris cristalligena]
MGKKPFIDRNAAKSYYVGHRSQHDPLVADSESSQRVLIEIGKNAKPMQSVRGEDKNRRGRLAEASVDELDAQVGQAALHGIYFDDQEYDYMQHLKPMNQTPGAVFISKDGSTSADNPPSTNQRRGAFTLRETETDDTTPTATPDNANANATTAKRSGIQLPPEALPSSGHMEVGLLNQEAYPRGFLLDYDPEVRATLEALEDEDAVSAAADQDFFDMLNAPGQIDYERDEEDDGPNSDWDEEQEFLWRVKQANRRAGSDADGGDSDEGGAGSVASGGDRRTTASKFSMTSSAMFRNENLTLIDERYDQFENLYATTSESETSDDEEEDMEMRDDFEAILDDFLDKYEVKGGKMSVKIEGETGLDKLDTVRRILGHCSLTDDPDAETDPSLRTPGGGEGGVPKPRKKGVTTDQYDIVNYRDVTKRYDNWDCESVLSTYSNLENHPALIPLAPSRRIKLNARTGMPSSTKPSVQSEEDNVDEDDENDEDGNSVQLESVDQGVPRPKGETAEEKRLRKQAVKEQKKNRRQEKKANKMAEKQDQLATKATRNVFAYQIPLS